jgi:uncharacterized membrane protein
VADLIVLGFKNMTAADDAITEIEQMQREGLITVADWARVIRRQDGRTDVRQAVNTTAAGALGGTFWGMLIGLIFLSPLVGAAIGAITGAISGMFTDVGIDDKFIKGLGKQIEPGTSALFVYVDQATADKVIDRKRQFQPEVLRTSLSEDSDAKLREKLQAAPAGASV